MSETPLLVAARSVVILAPALVVAFAICPTVSRAANPFSGDRCLDAAFELSTGVPDPKHPNENETIMSVNVVKRNDADPYNAIGFLYEVSDGNLYYSPRPGGSYTNSPVRYPQVELLAKILPKNETMTAREVAHFYGTLIPVSAPALKQTLHTLGLVSVPCTVWQLPNF